MTRSRLRYKFLHCRSNENKKAYNEQRNRCVKLVRSAKKLIIGILAIKTLMTIKYFGKQLNLFSLKKVNTNENITLVENSNIIASEIGIA